MVASLSAQQDRITRAVNSSRTITLRGNVDKRAQARYDRGAVDPGLEIGYARLLLQPSSTQQAALDRLLADQRNPASPQYRKWLTPEQFAGRFAVSAADAAKVAAWLRAQGLTVHEVARGRMWITFSGTARRVGAAFHTEIHRYVVDGETHFANVSAPSVPEALADVVAGFDGLTDFVLKPVGLAKRMAARLNPDFNSTTGVHALAPGDMAIIYNIKPLYAMGIDGTGQKIAVIGASSVNLTDIQNFRKRFNLPPADPQLVPVGTPPGTDPEAMGEADLDLEWSGAVARNATLIYVYARSVNTAAAWAIDQALAPVLSMSFGGCEPEMPQTLRALAQQANAEGITWLASSGDSGAATCDVQATYASASRGLAVSFPASMPEVTAVGGTQFDDGSGAYWNSQNGADLSSAISYIPEIAWNETGAPGLGGLASTGGGASILFTKPAWQAGPGVPNDNARDLPDVSLSSAIHDAYYVLSGGASHLYGGTSASTPAFAGIVALLNQSLSQNGLGNINPMLYRLAQNTTDVFHDIVSGANIVPCAQGSPDCANGSFGYQAGPGYDQATGLGSVDAYNLITEWSQASAIPTSTSLSASSSNVAWGDSAQLTATVTAASGSGTPTGTVTFLSGATVLGEVSLAGSGATASASLTAPTGQIGVGNQAVTAVYGGDSNFGGSSGALTLNVTAPPNGSAVLATISPNPIYQTYTSSGASQWLLTIRLTEVAGIGTTLRKFVIDGTDYTSRITSFFGGTAIGPNGTLTATLTNTALKSVPFTSRFEFTGVDAGGRQWTQQASAVLQGPLLKAAINLTAAPSRVLQNPGGDPSCQWPLQLTLQEQNGFPIELIGFLESGSGINDYSDQIQQYFGTTALAPFGTLQATICSSGITSDQTKTYDILGTDDHGLLVTAEATVSLSATPAVGTTLAVSQTAVTMTADASGNAAANLNVTLTGGSPQWSVSIFPSNRTTAWLSVSPGGGAASSPVSLRASGAGLAAGVYHATLIVQAPNGAPQVLEVPVAFIVGGSGATTISGVANGASFQTAFSPGMVLSVFGAGLAPAAATAASVPLPLTMQGVSVTVNGVTAPLYYVSPGQLNIQIPYETGAGTAILGVNNNGQVAAYSFQVAAAAPGIFTGQNGNIVPYTSGARGQTLLLFITGDGDPAPLLPTGSAPAVGTPVASLPAPMLPATLTIGGVQATIQFIGIPPGLSGVTQVNFVVPATAPLGLQPVVITVGGVASQTANLLVTQ